MNVSKEALLARTKADEKCLLWIGAKNSLGYGVVERSGVNRYVHRIIADAPPGVIVRHTCDNPSCINPDHLLLGTQAENVADAVQRGRIARGNALPQSKLSAELVKSIRAEYASGGVSQSKLAAKYGVHQMSISRVVRGATWSISKE